MTLERNPNSKNMFYVDPELFPITNEVEEAGNDKVYLDEETGKFIFEFPTLYKVWIPVDLGEDISNKRFILWVEKGIAQSAFSFTTIIEGTSVQTIDPNSSDFLIDTPSGERFYGYYVETESHGSSGEITFLVHPDTDFGSSPLGMALTHDDYVMSEWQSAYREAKIDLDPALSSKLITVGQLSRLKGSGTASGALSSKLITLGQLARLMGEAAPPDNQKGKFVTVEQVARALGVPAPAPPLPSGYTRLEYIEGTGAQYIDTAYFPCELTRVVTAITPTSGNATNGVFGGRTDKNISTFSLWCVSGVFRTDFDTNSQHVTTDVKVETGVRVEVDKDRGTTKLGSKTFTQTGTAFRAANSMHVFAVNPDSSGPRCFRGRIETFSIYESGLLEHELVPVRRASDGAVGMYDTVGGAFFANSGTGAFKAGPEVATASVDGAEGAAVTLRQFKVAAAKNGHR